MVVVDGFFLTMTSSSTDRTFHRFLETYQKTYLPGTAEGEKKYQQFCSNLELIQRTNRETKGYKLDINQFADQSLYQLEQNLLVCNFSTTPFPPTTVLGNPAPPTLNLTTSATDIDWTEKGMVSRVKNQGSCGSCWAFSTVGAIESMLRIHHGLSTDLSDQQVVDCSSSNHGCQGGLMDRAVQDMTIMGGIMPEADYPYTAQKATCHVDYRKTVPQTRNLRHGFVRPYDIDGMKEKLVSHGPLCTAVEVDPLHFLFYKEGVYDREKKNHHLNHAVLLTGFEDHDQKTPVWRIKNSWGTMWGEEGYMTMAMTKDGGEGVAGVHLYNMYLE